MGWTLIKLRTQPFARSSALSCKTGCHGRHTCATSRGVVALRRSPHHDPVRTPRICLEAGLLREHAVDVIRWGEAWLLQTMSANIAKLQEGTLKQGCMDNGRGSNSADGCISCIRSQNLTPTKKAKQEALAGRLPHPMSCRSPCRI